MSPAKKKPTKRPSSAPRKRAKAKTELAGHLAGAASVEQPVKVPQPHGGALLSGGVPGHIGGGGRPPDEFKKLCRELATRDATIEAVKGILENPAHPAYLGALKWATENGYGKPKESVEVSTKDGGPLAQVWLVAGKEIRF